MKIVLILINILISLTFLTDLGVVFGICSVGESESESDSELELSSEVLDSLPESVFPKCLLFWSTSESLKHTDICFKCVA